MQTGRLQNSQLKQLGRRPTAGALGSLCEENYRLLTALMPTVATMTGRYYAQPNNHPPLAIEVSRHGPYTQGLFMTHLFGNEESSSRITIPDAFLRLYHDAQTLEVEKFGKQMILPVDGLYDDPGLYQKWRANLFLGRWLRYCLSNSYLLTNLNKES